jgi:hypothetical protein
VLPPGPALRRPVFGLLAVAVPLLVVLGWHAGADARNPVRSRDFELATSSLSSERSEKVRVQAALVLGRAGEARATPFLVRALEEDASATVRAMAAQALGDVGDERARLPLEATAGIDPSVMVRRHAAAALTRLNGRLSADSIAINAMGDKTHHASTGLRERMREFVASELKGFRNHRPGGYRIDGSIKSLTVSSRLDTIEVECSVELVLSTWGNAIVMMSTGEAIVQRQRRQVRGSVQAAMEVEALEHAVRGASQELRAHFAANGP